MARRWPIRWTSRGFQRNPEPAEPGRISFSMATATNCVYAFDLADHRPDSAPAIPSDDCDTSTRAVWHRSVGDRRCRSWPQTLAAAGGTRPTGHTTKKKNVSRYLKNT